MLGFTKGTSSRASDRLRAAMDQWKLQPPPSDQVTSPPAQRGTAGHPINPLTTEEKGPILSWTWGSRSVRALIVVVAITVGVSAVLWWSDSPAVDVTSVQEEGSMELVGEDVGDSMGSVVVVHVAGAVAAPGLYEIPAGSRVADAVEAAGGVTKKNAANSVNLAREVVDGEQILVGTAAAGSTAGISINSASASDLEELPGVGPVLAERIVAHRNTHGPFRSVDDLGDVPGIGDSVLANIRTQATL